MKCLLKYFKVILSAILIVNIPSILTVTLKSRATAEEASSMALESQLLSMATTQGSNKRQRFTEDGQKCAKAFAQNNIVYEDCTSIKSPDGKDTKREWCYLESPVKGAQNWGYCKEIMDWDKVREASQNALKKVSEDVKSNINKSKNVIYPINSLIGSILSLNSQQNGFFNKVNDVNEKAVSLQSNMDNLNYHKTKWTEIEEKVMSLEQLIVQKEEEIEQEKRTEEENAKNDKGKIKFVTKTKDTITEDQTLTGITINPLLQDRIENKETVPFNMIDFEEDPIGNGLLAKYYDNCKFSGEPISEVVPVVDFEWNGIAPKEDINKDTFSIIFEGYIVPPQTNQYIFYVDSDDELPTIIIGRKDSDITDYRKKTNTNSLANRISNSMLTFSQLSKEPKATRTQSSKIKLMGGTPYYIQIKYKHNSFSKLNGERAFIKLSWVYTNTIESSIMQSYLFTRYPKENFKINIHQSIGVSKKLYLNDLAFKDREDFIIQDLPTRYIGLDSIKLGLSQLNQAISFTTNLPCIMYVAVVDNGLAHPPSGFMETGEYFSLIQVESNLFDYGSPDKKYAKKMFSKDSFVLKLYQKRIPAGNQNFKFEYDISDLTIFTNTKEKQGLIGLTGIIVFFGFDGQSNIHKACGVESKLISDPSAEEFKSCSASSEVTSCKNGFVISNRSKRWTSDHEGIGAWIQIEFNGEFEVSKIVFDDQSNPNSKGTIFNAIFSNGDEKELSVGNGLKQIWEINPPVITTSLKFMITSTQSNINNGGHFEIYGGKCYTEDESENDDPAKKIPEEIPRLFEDKSKKDDEIYSLSCYDSFEKSNVLDGIAKKVGKRIKIHCIDNCRKSPVHIYGTDNYAINSGICKAASHSGILPEEGGIVDLLILKGENSYSASTKNDISSMSFGSSEFTIRFLTTRSPQINEDPKATGPDSKKPITASIIRVKFAPEDYVSKDLKDVMIDNGHVFGYNNKPYGWSEDVSKKMKKVEGIKNMIADSSVVLNPDKKSVWCQTADCERYSWKMLVGPGKFKVKVYMHDLFQNFIMNLQVNGIPLVERTLVKKNILAEFEGIFTADESGFLIITDECNIYCQYAQAKMNFVEIEKYEDETSKEEEEKNKPVVASLEIAGKEENAFYKGRCETGDRVENCLYDDSKSPGTSFCRDPFKIVVVDRNYPDTFQRGKLKCIKKNYSSNEECIKYCPGTCDNKICNA